MVYISGGQVQDSQSPWRLSYIPEMFWSFVNFIVLFQARQSMETITHQNINLVEEGVDQEDVWEVSEGVEVVQRLLQWQAGDEVGKALVYLPVAIVTRSRT